MFARFFSFGRSAHRKITDAVYARIVASARQPGFYARWDVPDTPLGRYEMLCVHMLLFLRAARRGEGGREGALGDLAQEVTDEFFKDVDHSLRELGIGDLGVPKRMKKLARMFYGRAESYGAALDADDMAELAAALRRNVRPEAEAWPQAQDLAGYMRRAESALDGQAEGFLSAQIAFPDALALEEEG